MTARAGTRTGDLDDEATMTVIRPDGDEGRGPMGRETSETGRRRNSVWTEYER